MRIPDATYSRDLLRLLCACRRPHLQRCRKQCCRWIEGSSCQQLGFVFHLGKSARALVYNRISEFFGTDVADTQRRRLCCVNAPSTPGADHNLRRRRLQDGLERVRRECNLRNGSRRHNHQDEAWEKSTCKTMARGRRGRDNSESPHYLTWCSSLTSGQIRADWENPERTIDICWRLHADGEVMKRYAIVDNCLLHLSYKCWFPLGILLNDFHIIICKRNLYLLTSPSSPTEPRNKISHGKDQRQLLTR